METMPSIVVGLDGSETDAWAIHWAAREARLRHIGLTLLHAIDDVLLDFPRALPVREDYRGLVRQNGFRLLRAARDEAKRVAPDVEVAVSLRDQTARDALLTASRTAELLVLGSSPLSRAGRVFLGSVTIAVAAKAECPVVLVRPHVAETEPPEKGPVVVGVDGSPVSERAVEIAFAEASLRGAVLLAVHTWDDRLLAALFSANDLSLDRGAVVESEHAVLSERLAGWREKYPNVTVERRVIPGRAADCLLDHADTAQLLVVGSRGRGELTGLLLGSVSQAVLSNALCPVLVARPEPGEAA